MSNYEWAKMNFAENIFLLVETFTAIKSKSANLAISDDKICASNRSCRPTPLESATISNICQILANYLSKRK